MCLSHSAHGVVPEHAIFQGPFTVDLSFDETPVPQDYVRVWSGLAAGTTLPTWRVDRSSFIESPSWSPGVVSSGWGFTDSPDAEVIASGINTKGPNAVALGRQGPLFHWGFAGSPSQMTEAGQAAFLNAIAYIAPFDGAPLLVQRAAMARETVFDFLHHAGSIDELHASMKEQAEASNARREELIAKAEEGEITPEEKAVVAQGPVVVDPYAKVVASTFGYLFPADLIEQYGTESVSPYAAYYAENMDYLVFDEGSYSFQVDPDAKALGIPNRQVALLDRAVEMLNSDGAGEPELALTVLRRYTGEDFTEPAAWARWLPAVRDTLFFSDVGGFRFYSSDPAAAARGAHLGSEPLAREDWQRITVDARVADARVEPGQTTTLTVRLAMSPGWHVYAGLPEDSPYRSCRVELGPTDDVQAVGSWVLPKARPSGQEPGVTQYEGDAVFSIDLRAGAGTEGTLTVPVVVSYQACNRDSCLRPTSETLEVLVQVQR